MYLDLKNGEILDAEQLIVSVESIARASCVGYDLLILDEIEAIRTQFFSTTVDELAPVWHAFQKLVRNTPYVLALDACLSAYTVDVLGHMVARSGHELHLYDSSFQPFKRKFVEIYCGAGPAAHRRATTELFNRIVAALKVGKRVVFPSASASVLCEFEGILSGTVSREGVDVSGLDLKEGEWKVFTAATADSELQWATSNIEEAVGGLRFLGYSPIFVIGIDHSIRLYVCIWSTEDLVGDDVPSTCVPGEAHCGTHCVLRHE